MQMNCLRLLPLIAGCFLVGCAHTKPAPSAYISDPSFYFGTHQAPTASAFNAAVDEAVEGDDERLAYILSLARLTNASGSVSFGSVLVGLREMVGKERFNRVLASLSPADADAARRDVYVAEQREAAIVDQSSGL
jgi:hypothetical protein